SVVDELDRALLERRRGELKALAEEAAALADRAGAVTGLPVDGDADQRFLQLFGRTYQALAGGLRALARQYRAQAAQPDQEIQQAVLQALADVRTSKRTPEELEALEAEHGGKAAAVSRVMNDARATLSRRFLDLEGPLQQRVDSMHEDLARVLIEAGRLGGPGTEPGRDFLVELLAQVPPGGLTEDIHRGLSFVCQFTLNYRGLLQHRVRRALEQLHPNQVGIPPDPTMAEMQYLLSETYNATLAKVEASLNTMLTEPPEAVYALVDEFSDRALAVDVARDAWQLVYRKLRARVWPEEFAAIAANAELVRRWTNALTGVEHAARGTYTELV
ncbi:hypothetical protein ACFW1A_14390, partial [Kitasatospora sp. NPDC058965]|uniref:hypothetical protein n=1 Tax=Kitasatospora sp. NPDC058965 TaxID=3346682 RepID=UPI0036856F9F